MREYLPICLETFTLPDETFDRLDELCLFSKKREGAPIQRPQDWSALGKILTDIDPAKREEMLDDVRKNKVPPRVVSGNRNRELQQLDWAHWLQQLLVVIKGVNLGGIEGNEEERTVVKELGELFERLPREEG